VGHESLRAARGARWWGIREGISLYGPMPRTVDDDLELWQRARNDPEARAELSAWVHDVARAELARRGYRGDERDDHAQETVMTVLRYLDRGGEIRKNLRGFVQFRVRGVLSDRRRPEPTSGGEVDLDRVAGSGEAPGARLLTHELMSALEECCAELPDGQRDVAELRCRDGLSSVQIAERLNLERGTVNTRASRALVRIRECLERKGFEA